MQDRIPTQGQEGRVLITPEDGSPAYYAKVEMADNPSQAGTPLNKATLLKDETAALYGLGTDAVPDDVFAYVGRYNQHWWRRRKPGGVSIVDGDTVQTYNLGSGYSQTRNITVTYSPEAEIVDGNIKIKTEQTLTATYATYTVFEELRGKFIMASEVGSDTSVLVKAKENAAVTQRNQSGVYYVDIEATIPKIASIPPGEWEYLYSSDRSAYPDSGVQDGYEYEYLGIPFDNAVTAPKIETGSYVGTGTKGPNNPCSVTFNFVPKFVAVIGTGSWLFLRQGIKGNYPGSGDRGGVNNVVTSGMNDKTITWYVNNTTTTNYEQYQCNTAGVTYNYIALG